MSARTDRACLASITCAIATFGLAAQTPQTPVFRAGTEIVQLDVSVLDRNRRPVRGLVQGDFTVLEDGKPQRIDVFNAIDVPSAVAPRAAWMPRVTPDVTTNERQEARLFVLVMDDATPELNVFALASAKKIARSVIDKLGPADLMSVVFTRDNRHAQDFTADRRKLLAAVDSFTMGFRGAGGPDTLWFQYSVNALSEASNFLIALPERRKAIVYVGQGVPFDPDELAPHLSRPVAAWRAAKPPARSRPRSIACSRARGPRTSMSTR